MEAMTLRKIPRELSRRLRKKAAQEGNSLNRTVIGLLEESFGLSRKAAEKPQRRGALHHDLDPLAGRWTKEEAAAFEQVLQQQRAVEPDDWK